jgi:hypothetical protein
MGKRLSLSVHPCAGGRAKRPTQAAASAWTEPLIWRWVHVLTNNARLIIGNKSIGNGKHQRRFLPIVFFLETGVLV